MTPAAIRPAACSHARAGRTDDGGSVPAGRVLSIFPFYASHGLRPARAGGDQALFGSTLSTPTSDTGFAGSTFISRIATITVLKSTAVRTS